MPQKQIAGKSTNQQPDLVATSVFMAFERPNKIFPTVFENTVEPLWITTAKTHLTPCVINISASRLNSCGLSKSLNGHQGQTLKNLGYDKSSNNSIQW